MALAYQEMRDLIEAILQDSTNATYGTTELNLLMDNAIREFSPYAPHIVDVIFKIESRTGTTTSATSLTDTTKDQFVAGDATDEKVVHNTTDNTWAVVLVNSSTEVNTLSADIMASGDSYRIYNKRCTNEKQIYIGDVTDYLWIDSVEYPLGEKRNWKVYGEVLEIDVDSVQDSNSVLDPPKDIDALIRFAKPHRLCQLTDVDGEVNLEAGYDEGDVTMAFDGTAGTVEAGDEFNLENHRTLYTVTTGGAATMTFFPGLEADVSDNDDINFVKSTLKPHHEEIFCYLVVARAVLSHNITNIDAINKGGADVWLRYQNWGERKLAEVIGKMERLSPLRTKRRYATA